MKDRLEAYFEDPADARRSIERLLADGVEPGSISMVSYEPHLEFCTSLIDAAPRTMIPYFSLAGGVIGALVGFALVYLTSHSYPLVTGGMPLVPPLTTGIVIYEVAAMGAIFAALLRMIWEGGLLRWSEVRGSAPSENRALTDGSVKIILKSRSDDLDRWGDVLVQEGGTVSAVDI
jgi:Alternative complex III, ActD subunit